MCILQKKFWGRQFAFFWHKWQSLFWDPGVVVVHRFDCAIKTWTSLSFYKLLNKKTIKNFYLRNWPKTSEHPEKTGLSCWAVTHDQNILKKNGKEEELKKFHQPSHLAKKVVSSTDFKRPLELRIKIFFSMRFTWFILISRSRFLIKNVSSFGTLRSKLRIEKAISWVFGSMRSGDSLSTEKKTCSVQHLSKKTF